MKIIHSRTQRAIGQGGFHSAVIENGSNVLRYIYDCGSTDLNRLRSAIADQKADASSIDILFLSHLDQDHVNGVDRLLEAVHTKMVVLPYLMPFERLLLAAECAAAPTGPVGTQTYAEMLLNPVRWFLVRGTRRVIFVRRPSSEAEPPAAFQVDTYEPLDPVDRRVRNRGIVIDDEGSEAITEDDHPDADRRSIGSTIEQVRVMDSGPLYATSRSRRFWELIPFVHPEPIHAPAFIKAVARFLNLRKAPPADDRRWLKCLKTLVIDANGRSKLASLYRSHIRKDRNLTSMCLFSGPIVSPNRQVKSKYTAMCGSRTPVLIHPQPHLADKRIAWLGTGDAHLDRKRRRIALERFFSKHLQRVGTIVLPHHGSARNIRTNFIQTYPDRFWVAPYGTKNSFRHPDAHLMRVAETYGIGVRVTENRSTEFIETMALEW